MTDCFDEIDSGDVLVSVVQDPSVRPSDPQSLPSPSTMLNLNVVLLSRISGSSDEVIGYKSPVFQDNSLGGWSNR